MAQQERSLKRPRDKQTDISQQGGDELHAAPKGENAKRNPTEQQANRKKMRVTERHQTEKMEKDRRGTFP